MNSQSKSPGNDFGFLNKTQGLSHKVSEGSAIRCHVFQTDPIFSQSHLQLGCPP